MTRISGAGHERANRRRWYPPEQEPAMRNANGGSHAPRGTSAGGRRRFCWRARRAEPILLNRRHRGVLPARPVRVCCRECGMPFASISQRRLDAHPGGRGARVSILIVDDSDATNRSLQAFLQSRGYPAVQTVTSGAAALRLLGEGTPAASPGDVEVILLDVGLPDLDGIEVCRRLKAAAPLKDIPVLIITGATDEQILERAFAVGACDFLPKPIRLP